MILWLDAGVIEESVRNMNKDVNKRLKAPIFKSKNWIMYVPVYFLVTITYMTNITQAHLLDGFIMKKKGFILLSVDENISNYYNKSLS